MPHDTQGKFITFSYIGISCLVFMYTHTYICSYWSNCSIYSYLPPCTHARAHIHTHEHKHTQIFFPSHTCICTLLPQCMMDPGTREPLDTLTPHAQQQIQTLGSHNTKVSQIVALEDRAVFTAIQKGLDRVNEHATSQAQKVGI